VRVAVADELQVNVIAQPSAGAHRVQLLPRLGTSDQAVHGVGSDSLSGVNGGGIAEFDGGSYVAGRQVDAASGTAVLNPETTVVINTGYSPAVAVLHPVRG
jgi:hypothetical protein